MAAPYIPATDAGFSAWILNFSTLITATPTAYGLTAGNATTIAAQNTAYQAAYTAANDPSTRTPETVAAKDAARAAATAVVRPFAMQINASAAVTNGQRAALGLTIRKTVPTPVPAPTDIPTLGLVSGEPGLANMQYRNPSAPDGKAKPYGCIGVQLCIAVGTTPAIDPSQGLLGGTVTKSPFVLGLAPTSAGKVITVYGRFVTQSGPGGVAQAGPWSAPVSFFAM